MRKYLAIVLGVLLILSFAVTASAMDTDITLGGKILVRGWYFKNVTYGVYNLPQDSNSQAVYTTNANITLDVKVEENVRGFMELETSCFGNNNCGLYYWGRPSGYDTKADADLRFRQLWIQYTGSGLLGAPAGIKVGHMPIVLGEKQFLNNERFGDDGILVWVDPTKELHIALGTAKLAEGAIDEHWDDVDGYIGIVTYQIDKDNMVGANYTWVHSDGNCPSLQGGVPAPDVEALNFHNVGIHANGNVSGFTYAAEADFQFGRAKDVLFSGNDLKASGWGVFAKVGYMIDPVNIRASFAYGSGDSDPNDTKCKEMQTLQGPDEIGPLARLVHHTQIYERTISTTAQNAILTTTPGGNTRNTGIANTTLYNLGFDVNPAKDLKLSLDGFIIRASNVPDGSGWSKSAGTELDFRGSYQIAKNLSYFVEAAGFWPGDYYQDAFAQNADETVTQLIHGILLTF